MTRRDFLKRLFNLAVYGAAAWKASDIIGWALDRLLAGKKPPNIVFLILDTWRYDHFTPELTPGMWELAKRGIRFTRYFVNSGYTRPSMASIFSGKLPKFEPGDEPWRELGFRIPNEPMFNHLGMEVIPPNFTTFQGLLKDFGYCTIAVVKNGMVGRLMGYGWRQWSILVDVPFASSAGGDTLAEKAVKLLRERNTIRRRKPYLLYVHFMDSHRPYDRSHLSEEDIELQETYFNTRENGDLKLRAKLLPEVFGHYQDGVRFLDEQVCILVDRVIKESGIDDTYFFISADHGEMFNETGEVWNIGHGGQLPKEIVHVPMIVFGGDVETGQVNTEMREGLDIAPTMLSIAGIPPLGYMKGASLLKRAGKKVVESLSALETAFIRPAKDGDFSVERVPMPPANKADILREQLHAMGYFR